MSGPTLRVLPGGRVDGRPQADGGERRRGVSHPSEERTATARTLPDDPCNAEWNELLKCVETAWIWRDPESFGRLVSLVARLREHVARDWSR